MFCEGETADLATLAWTTGDSKGQIEPPLMHYYFFNLDSLKGLLHPKMKILSLITYPHVVPNP